MTSTTICARKVSPPKTIDQERRAIIRKVSIKPKVPQHYTKLDLNKMDQEPKKKGTTHANFLNRPLEDSLNMWKTIYLSHRTEKNLLLGQQGNQILQLIDTNMDLIINRWEIIQSNRQTSKVSNL